MRRRDASVKFTTLPLDTAAAPCHSPRMQQTHVPPLVIALDQAINNIQGACSDEDVPVRDLAEWQKAAWLLTVLRNSAATFGLAARCEISDVAAALCWLAKNAEDLAATVAAPQSTLLDASGHRLGGGVTAGQSAVADEMLSKARIWRAAINVGRMYDFEYNMTTPADLARMACRHCSVTTALFAHTTAKLLQMLTQSRSQQEAQAAMYLVSAFAADTAYLSAEVAKT